MPDRDWTLRGECRKYPPDWWFPDHGGARASTGAVRICVFECPVRRECGRAANESGERFAVAGGFRCSISEERADLRAWLDEEPPSTSRPYCGCGRRIPANSRYPQCMDCWGSVPAPIVRKAILAAHAAGMSYSRMVAATGVSRTTLTGIARGHHGSQQWHTVDRDKADRIFAALSGPVPS